MLSPGSKGWIKKYHNLVLQGDIKINVAYPSDMSADDYLHLTFGNTGLLFGTPSDLIFAKQVGEEDWTKDESLKILYFESLLSVYLIKNEGKKDFYPDFIYQLTFFFESGGNSQTKNWIQHLFKMGGEIKLEEILHQRIKIRKKIDNKLWVNYLNNSLIFLDVVLFRLFLEDHQSDLKQKRKELTITTLQTIIYAVHLDKEIEQREQTIFEIFLASSDLEETEKKVISKEFKKGIQLKNILVPTYFKPLFRRYMLDLALLTIWADDEEASWDESLCLELAKHLSLENHVIDECKAIVETFVLQNQDARTFLNSPNSYEKMLGNFSGRWLKILGRNKDKLAIELRESKELVLLIKKSTKEELSSEEKEKVKSQFMDIIKSMPALAIFMLPGGALLLPIVLKIIPDLIPSAFRENEIEEKK